MTESASRRVDIEHPPEYPQHPDYKAPLVGLPAEMEVVWVAGVDGPMERRVIAASPTVVWLGWSFNTSHGLEADKWTASAFHPSAVFKTKADASLGSLRKIREQLEKMTKSLIAITEDQLNIRLESESK